MKNKLLKVLTIIFCLPIMFFCGCSDIKSNLDTINLASYYEDSVTCSTYGKSGTTKISLSALTAEKPNEKLVGQYTQFDLTAKSSWIYKMYIDYIYFYVYTNMDLETQMTVNISITNLADENNIENPSDDFTADCSLIPQEGKSYLCEVKVQKVVATATGSKISFDVNNTPEIFYGDGEEQNNFKWIIYGLEFYAESRAYSK